MRTCARLTNSSRRLAQAQLDSAWIAYRGYTANLAVLEAQIADAEIPLAWSGNPRVPLTGDLTDEEDGDWFFRSVNMFGGSAFVPNRVTCSCIAMWPILWSTRI